jgi:hypothetical protein
LEGRKKRKRRKKIDLDYSKCSWTFVPPKVL